MEMITLENFEEVFLIKANQIVAVNYNKSDEFKPFTISILLKDNMRIDLHYPNDYEFDKAVIDLKIQLANKY